MLLEPASPVEELSDERELPGVDVDPGAPGVQRRDVRLIDGLLVNGSARLVGWFSQVLRGVQSGYLYHYAFAMLVGVIVLMSYFVSWPMVSGWFNK